MKRNKATIDVTHNSDLSQTKKPQKEKISESYHTNVSIPLPPKIFETFTVSEFKYRFFSLDLEQYRELFPTTDGLYNYTLEFLTTGFAGSHSLYIAYHSPPTFHSYYISFLPSPGGLGCVFEVDSRLSTLYISIEGDYGDRQFQVYHSSDPAPAYLSLVALPIFVPLPTVEEPSFYTTTHWPQLHLEPGKPYYSITNYNFPIFYVFQAIYSEGAHFHFSVSLKKGANAIYISTTDPYPYEGGDNLFRDSMGQENRSTSISRSFEITPENTTFYIAIRSPLLSGQQTLTVWVNSTDYDMDAILLSEKTILFTTASEPLNYKFYLPSTAQYKWIKLSFFIKEKTQVFIKVGEVASSDNYTWKVTFSLDETNETQLHDYYNIFSIDDPNTDSNDYGDNNDTDSYNENNNDNNSTSSEEKEDWVYMYIPSTESQFTSDYYYIFIKPIGSLFSKSNTLIFELARWAPRQL